ncbi:MAG: hypothetical protein ACWGO2_02575 [Syntrophobacteria bacterium]
MTSPIQPGMISSKEVMARTGISRATLNNYIGLDLIPPPSVRPPEEPGGPTKIGYFPEWVVERIEKIHQLKGQGMRMSQIAIHFMDEKKEPKEAAAQPLMYQWLDQIIFPAILVSRSWEIIGLNNMAEKLLLGEERRGLQSPVKRQFLDATLIRELKDRFANWREILIPHIRLAKKDLGAEILQPLHREEDSQLLNQLRQLWNEAELPPYLPFGHQTLSLKYHHGGAEQYTLLSWALPEGTLLLYAPASMQLDQMIDLLTGRAKISIPALLREAPSPKPLCILAARLESELHLRTALPPCAYIDLINQIILGWHRCFRDHGATPGRSYQEGAVCFFLEEPEREDDHLFQSLLCAKALNRMVRRIDREWKSKQPWNNTLRVNIGIHCGRDWLGMVPSPSAFEFTVVGDTLVEAVKLSEFSQGGAIWASKEVIENLSPSNRERVEFGIRLGLYEEGFVSPGLYSPVAELLSQDELKEKRLQSIASLAVTEVLDVLT